MPATDRPQPLPVIDTIAIDEDAYKASLHASTSAQAAYVSAQIGTRTCAAALGLKDARPLRSWAAGTVIKQSAVRNRLRVLYRATYALTTAFGADTAASFWVSTNPYLQDRSPVAVLGTTSDVEHAETLVVSALRSLMEA